MIHEGWQFIVVEDEYDSLQMVSDILRFHGINVLIAHNGRECLDLLTMNSAHLVVTDLAMPEMDGWETLNAIRSNPRTAMIPVVAISAYHSVEVAEKARAAGFDAFYAKPISPKAFVQNLAKLVSQ
ncbi:MAG: response regulator [Anaerolineaceae bacterium]|nr:response regulator [Anaerolineaceae bacterium]